MIWKRGQANGRRSSNQNPKNKNRLVSSNLCAWLLSPWHYSQGLLLKATPKPPGRNMNLLLIMCHRWLEPKTNSIACHEILVGENEFPLKSYNKSWVYHLESRKGATSNAMVYHSPLLFGVAPSTLTTVFILPSNRYFAIQVAPWNLSGIAHWHFTWRQLLPVPSLKKLTLVISCLHHFKEKKKQKNKEN